MQRYRLAAAVRDALAAGLPVSGQELAARFGVSRNAVWKALEQLRRLGYTVAATSGHGYRLLEAPDVPYPWEVRRWLENDDGDGVGWARTLHYYPSVDSTNTRARRLAEAGAPEGTAVLADRQTEGRGRRGRRWHSPSGGLYLSVVLRPPAGPERVALLGLVGALAVSRALEACCHFPALIKWPNDVIIQGRKVAGILAEVAADPEWVHHAVLGIGINVAPWPKAEGVLPRAGALRQFGCSTPRAHIAAAVLRELAHQYRTLVDGETGALLESVRRRLLYLGQPVQAMGPGFQGQGILDNIDADGRLCLRLGDGRLVRLTAADISVRLPGQADAPQRAGEGA